MALNLTAVILSGNSSELFRGFLVQARLQADDITRIGDFAVTDELNSRLSSCPRPAVRSHSYTRITDTYIHVLVTF